MLRWGEAGGRFPRIELQERIGLLEQKLRKRLRTVGTRRFKYGDEAGRSLDDLGARVRWSESEVAPELSMML